MTDFEIVQAYRDAKDKKMQIGILAEMNVCRKGDIKEALIRGGVPESEIPEIRGGNQKSKPKEPQEANEEEKKISKREAVVNTIVVDAIEGLMIDNWATARRTTEQELMHHLGQIQGILYMGRLMKEGKQK